MGNRTACGCACGDKRILIDEEGDDKNKNKMRFFEEMDQQYLDL
jgi:hypothetical protein